MELKIYEFDYLHVPEIKEDFNLCLGFFDGIHLGHQKIINAALKDNSNTGLLTFDVSPAFVRGLRDSNRVLTSVWDKAEILDSMGVKYLFILHLDKTLLEMDKLEFIFSILNVLHPKKVYCGEDYRFGYHAEGDPKLLSRYFQVEEFKLEKIDGKKVSSREITTLIQLGDIEAANKLLGRKYFLTGLVVEGRQNGRKLGYPTANLEPDYPNILPAEGVYACYVDLFGKQYKAVLCYSKQPTFAILNNAILEVNILDFDGNIYGLSIKIELVKKMRGIIRFEKIEDLVAQLQKDVESVKLLLK